MTLTGAQLTTAQLKREGIEIIFSLNGGHIFGIYDSCIDAGIRILDVRHEDAAVHMAHAWSRFTDGIGVACVTAGPGLTNTTTAVANAWVAASPLVLIAGRVPTKQFDLGALQDVDQGSILRVITKSGYCALEGRRIPEYVHAALRLAQTSPYGPTYLELPTDVLREHVENEPLVEPCARRASARPRPDLLAINAAVQILERAERPVIIAGSGVMWSRAYAQLLAFAERIEAPVLTTSLARGAMPLRHPLSLGAARSWLLARADAIVVVGARFNYQLGYGRPPRFSEKAAIIQIDTALQELGRNRTVDVMLQGDAAASLEELAAAISYRADPRAWLNEARTHDSNARAALEARAMSSATPIHPLRLCREVRRAVPPDSIIILDGGDILSFGRLMVELPGPMQFLDPGPFGCLGVGLPFTNAAKLARPGHPVVCITGDGALGFHVMEFDTAVRHKLPIVVVVSNNAAWGIEAASQRLDFGEDRIVGTMLRDSRFDRIADALGGYGQRVTDPAGIGPAIKRALESGKPSLVDVVTDARCMSPDLQRGLARVPDLQPLDFYGEQPS